MASSVVLEIRYMDLRPLVQALPHVGCIYGTVTKRAGLRSFVNLSWLIFFTNRNRAMHFTMRTCDAFRSNL